MAHQEVDLESLPEVIPIYIPLLTSNVSTTDIKVPASSANSAQLDTDGFFCRRIRNLVNLSNAQKLPLDLLARKESLTAKSDETNKSSNDTNEIF